MDVYLLLLGVLGLVGLLVCWCFLVLPMIADNCNDVLDESGLGDLDRISTPASRALLPVASGRHRSSRHSGNLLSSSRVWSPAPQARSKQLMGGAASSDDIAVSLAQQSVFWAAVDTGSTGSSCSSVDCSGVE